MDAEDLKELKSQIKSLHSKLDKYNEKTVQNSADIAWLKRGMFGSIFTYIGAIVYAKAGGS